MVLGHVASSHGSGSLPHAVLTPDDDIYIEGFTGQKGDVGVTATPPPGTTPPTSPCTKTMGPDKVTAATSLISH